MPSLSECYLKSGARDCARYRSAPMATSKWTNWPLVVVMHCATALKVRARRHAAGRYLADHLFELEVERQLAVRYSLWYEPLQALGQDARIEQAMAYEVNEMGELLVGELDRHLKQWVETSQHWVYWTQRPL